MNRRDVINLASFGVTSAVLAKSAAFGNLAAAATGRKAQELAGDEEFWLAVQQAYALDHRYIMLNTGGSNPAPRSVHEAHLRYLAYVNASPFVNTYRSDVFAGLDSVKKRIARHISASPEEIALTRGTTEGLAIAIGSFDLAQGDEIVTTTDEHSAVRDAIRLREQRDGAIVRTVEVNRPVRNKADVVAAFSSAFGPRTKAVVICDIQGVAGQIMPVKEVCASARKRGIVSIVDGAIGFGHLERTDVADMGCDYYATSLHKYLSAPLGTGFLYVRQPLIASTWPLYGVSEDGGRSVSKFEAVGSRSYSELAAVAQALDFWETVGPARKAARLHYLKAYWVNQVKDEPRLRFSALADPEHSCGTLGVGVEGITGQDLSQYLRERHRIWAYGPIKVGTGTGVYCAPNLFTRPADLDQFVSALRAAARSGIAS